MINKTVLAVLAMAVIASVGYAELQNVEVGGSIRIRGNYYDMDSLGDSSWIEQRTRLNVKADFTSDVSAFIEFDYYNNWGEDFRSLYLTGADFRGSGGNDVDLYQGYIEAANMWGTPLSMRVGRQELSFGTEWLVGVNDAAALFTGLSFDALRLTYAIDTLTIDAVAAKLVETMSDFGDDDTDFYAIYASYLGIEDVTLDAYWMFLRDDGVALGDDVDVHTVGLRGAGVIGAFDFDVEAAYQFGDVDGRPSACPLGFGEADVNYDAFAVNSELGYTFDMAWTPRVFARFAWFEGGDDDDSLCSNDRDLPFNRLFSNWEYTEFWANTDESNLFYYALGVGVAPTECLTLSLVCAYFEVDEEAPETGWWFWRNDVEDELGIELGLYADYQYSEDLVFRAGYAHFFGDEGLEDNNFVLNGLAPLGGDEDDDYDYLFIETELCF